MSQFVSIDIEHKNVSTSIEVYKGISSQDLLSAFHNTFNLIAQPVALYDTVRQIIVPLSVVSIHPRYFDSSYALLLDPFLLYKESSQQQHESASDNSRFEEEGEEEDEEGQYLEEDVQLLDASDDDDEAVDAAEAEETEEGNGGVNIPAADIPTLELLVSICNIDQLEIAFMVGLWEQYSYNNELSNDDFCQALGERLEVPDVFSEAQRLQVLRTLFVIGDTNADNVLDMHEFVVLITLLCARSELAKEVQPLFDFFDRDRDGVISRAELLEYLEGFMPQQAEVATELFFQEADLNQDEKVSFLEFKYWCTRPHSDVAFLRMKELHFLQQPQRGSSDRKEYKRDEKTTTTTESTDEDLNNTAFFEDGQQVADAAVLDDEGGYPLHTGNGDSSYSDSQEYSDGEQERLAQAQLEASMRGAKKLRDVNSSPIGAMSPIEMVKNRPKASRGPPEIISHEVLGIRPRTRRSKAHPQHLSGQRSVQGSTRYASPKPKFGLWD